MTRIDRGIVVLGGGPAGAAVALGLRRLGHAVTVVGVPRAFDAIEGVSDRVVAGLRGVGIEAALAAIAEPSLRRATWAGATTALNSERLVDRAAFDSMLWQELQDHGVECIAERVMRWTPGEHGDDGHALQIQRPDETQPTTLRARFVVEARGRLAPHPPQGVSRGPETVALLWRGQGAPGGEAGSAVESLPGGWAWCARLPGGAVALQLTVDPSAIALPQRAQLGAFVRERLSTVDAALPFLDTAATEVHALARTSGAVLAPEVCGATWLRVGDAAMAADPLSGNGIFQSLSSALQAPMVVHTLLNHPADAPHARRFHTERVQGLFQRFARIGRDFYAQEARWADEPFWAARRAWPDALPAHGAAGNAPPHIEGRPVVDRDRIRLAEVVVTAEQPLGIWHVDGVEIAPLWRAAQAAPGREAQALAPLLGGDAGRAQAALRWMRAQGWR
ncbi:aromatic-ring hydroxylase protein conaining monooxygenase FAD-binding domain [Hydrogenophaga taeniospiralis CCUG 15921]|uniref:Aromatic-ring hydroxylase protein conaining monooxygenase FAD-binding domain n=1 Tax=Hydrogenophaga taeniospiralis CCUG 15921 TaxID=1281780 RepID=A0A9X4SHQ7_9BURK|nr:FAD-dependent oxidoreductase [Hydrogenophaga taeniospiralis]MDG5978271.1 aromatic-ring hydroxylase protein conaining monooxygenase FAD-binding domain [Hydrogenophaga taeniospiralis CCUG 15921]